MINLIFKTVLFMSVSGSLLIMILLAGKRFLKNKLSRQWQYYIWLIVLLRLLLPFDPEINLMGSVHQIFDWTVTPELSPAGQENPKQDTDDLAVYSENMTQEIQKTESAISAFLNGIGWFWMIVALGMLIRKITAYQSFVRYITAGAEPVSDIALLEELSAIAAQMGATGSVELSVNPLLSSPTLTGVFRPCIILPGAEVSREDFRYIVIHELTHCKRWDIFYKWLVQFVVCLHWFNPLVHLMGREVNNACEFSCDEAVLEKTGYENARDYGKTLLNTMAAVGKYRESSAAVTLSANKALLKERLGAIMSCGEKSGAVRILTVVLTICIILGTVFVGIRPTPADAAEASEAEKTTVGHMEKDKRESEWDEKQMEEYRAVGVTKEGKNINPAGTVNVQIMHREDGQITGAAYLTDEEFEELFGDMAQEDSEDYPRVMYVNCRVCKVRAGAGEKFAVVGLMAEEEAVTVLEMVEGSGERNWYRIDKESLPEDMDISADECYIRADLLREK